MLHCAGLPDEPTMRRVRARLFPRPVVGVHDRQTARRDPDPSRRVSLKERLTRHSFKKVRTQEQRHIAYPTDRLADELHGQAIRRVSDHRLDAGNRRGRQIIDTGAATRPTVISNISRDDVITQLGRGKLHRRRLQAPKFGSADVRPRWPIERGRPEETKNRHLNHEPNNRGCFGSVLDLIPLLEKPGIHERCIG